MEQCKTKLEDTQRIIINKDSENSELKSKLKVKKQEMLNSESEYSQLREGIASVLKSNKTVKTELNVLQSALRHENDLDQDNHYRLDTLRRNLAKNKDEIHWQDSKEE